MLAALLLLGLLPLAALPMGQDGFADDAEPDESVPDQDTAMGDDILDDDPDVAEASDDPPEDGGTVHRLDASPGEQVIEQFEPGVDMVEVDLTGVAGEVSFETSVEEDAAFVSFSLGPQTTSTIEFVGLSEVPDGDIMLRLLDDQTGEPYDISLSDAMAQSTETDPGAEVLDPVDPDAPDEPGPVVDPTDVLDPTDPDSPDDPGPDPGEPGLDPVDPDLPDGPADGEVVGPALNPIGPNDAVLGPEGELGLHGLLQRDTENLGGLGETLQQAAAAGVIETDLGGSDDTVAQPDDGVVDTGTGSLGMSKAAAAVIVSASPVDVVDGCAGDDAISLGDSAGFGFGGIDDDALVLDRNDVASGGAGSDQFWLYHDGADAGGVADVTDFIVGEDFLQVSLSPHIGENGAPVVLVEPSGDGIDGLVTVNGDLVAILRGAPHASPADVHAEVQADLFG